MISALSPVPSYALNLVEIRSLKSDDIHVIASFSCWYAVIVMLLLFDDNRLNCALKVTACVVYIKLYGEKTSVPLLQTHDQMEYGKNQNLARKERQGS